MSSNQAARFVHDDSDHPVRPGHPDEPPRACPCSPDSLIGCSCIPSVRVPLGDQLVREGRGEEDRQAEVPLGRDHPAPKRSAHPADQRVAKRQRVEPSRDVETWLQTTAAAGPGFDAREQRARAERHAVVPLTHDGEADIVFEGEYVFVNCEGEDDVDRPTIALVDCIYDGCKRVLIRWLYHPVTERLRGQFGPNELLMSDWVDTISWDSLLGLAAVVPHCPDCATSDDWCWNRWFDPATRRTWSEDGMRKRRPTVR